ncbi:hypothetical protein B0H12DRAFT_131731 [Mycena haematopus]|nr:hypothetical protein B0H12DRAFT_131731 [Mycena haematopus]
MGCRCAGECDGAWRVLWVHLSATHAEICHIIAYVAGRRSPSSSLLRRRWGSWTTLRRARRAQSPACIEAVRSKAPGPGRDSEARRELLVRPIASRRRLQSTPLQCAQSCCATPQSIFDSRPMTTTSPLAAPTTPPSAADLECQVQAVLRNADSTPSRSQHRLEAHVGMDLL